MSNQLPVSDPDFWRRRIEMAERTGHPHHSVFLCTESKWTAIEEAHRKILAKYIGSSDKVLDAGCGYGRLKAMLPDCGLYRGIDVSPELIERARHLVPPYMSASEVFRVGDLRYLPEEWGWYFNWGILVSIRPMIRRNLGDAEWSKMEAELRRCCRKLLYLEYDENDPGSVE